MSTRPDRRGAGSGRSTAARPCTASLLSPRTSGGPSCRPERWRRGDRGFSLVEVLVALVLAAVGCVVIYQVLSMAEQRKRSTTGGGDAQVQGNLALLALERDIASAGWGLSNLPPGAFGCPLSVGGTAVPLFNVWATDGGADANGLPLPDTLTVIAGNSPLMTNVVTYTSLSGGQLAIATGPIGFRLNVNGKTDYALVADGLSPGKCVLTRVIGTTAMSAAGAAGSATANPGITTADLTSAGLAATGSVANLGDVPRIVRWSIADNGQLVSQLLQPGGVAGTTTPVADGIVNLQVQFGFDANANGRIDDATEWFNPNDPGFLPATQPALYARVMAVRVAVLSRSAQYEKGGVYFADGAARTATATTDRATIADTNRPAIPWTGAAFHIGTAASVSATEVSPADPGNPDDWRNYRYRVYATGLVPLNNVWK